jgi:acetyltransferase-like isoleucine patch superfamily enzyme
MKKHNFKFRAESATYFPSTVFINAHAIELNENTHIDDFVFFNGGEKSVVSNNVHIAAFTSIVGGGSLHLDSFSSISGGCRLITGSDDFSGEYLTNPTVSIKYRNVNRGSISVGKHALLGSNCIVMPDVVIGDGVIVAAGSIVNQDLESWSIYSGSHPIKKISEIPPRMKLNAELQFLAEEYPNNVDWVEKRIVEIEEFLS